MIGSQTLQIKPAVNPYLRIAHHILIECTSILFGGITCYDRVGLSHGKFFDSANLRQILSGTVRSSYGKCVAFCYFC